MNALIWAAMAAPLWAGGLAIAWQARQLAAAIRRHREENP